MDKLSPNNLDALFRESSEQAEFEYRPEAWAAPDERLDKRDRRRVLLRWIAGVTVLLALLAGAAYQMRDNATDTPTEQTSGMTAETSAGNVISEPQLTVTETTTAANSNRRTANEPTAVQSTPTPTGEQAASVTENIVVTPPAVPFRNTAQAPFADTQNAVETAADNYAQANAQAQTQATVIASENTLKSVATTVTEVLPVRLNAVTATAVTPELPDPTTSGQIEPHRTSRLTFGVFGASDFAAVEFGNTMAGYRFGLRTDYAFARRFSVGVGVSFSKKRYCAAGSQYTAKPGFWTDGIAPQVVTSNCRIVELPVELRWYTNGSDRSGFFVGAGANTYLMNLEQFDFDYEEELPGSIKTWEERGTNKHFFGIGTLTFGYRQTLSRDLILEFAPYAHLPLTGIGQGKVALQSAGVSVGLYFKK